MSESTYPIQFALTDTYGRQYDTVIPTGLAKLAPDGTLLSFIVVGSDNVFGETFVLSERSPRTEEMARKIALLAGASLLTLTECKVYEKATDEKVNPFMSGALTIINKKLLQWATEKLPLVPKEELGYYDVNGRLRFRNLIYVS